MTIVSLLYHVATCWHSRVKGLTIVANNVFNGWRFEDVWLDR
jgi:peptide/nickel transport system substrate-binding protein